MGEPGGPDAGALRRQVPGRIRRAVVKGLRRWSDSERIAAAPAGWPALPRPDGNGGTPPAAGDLTASRPAAGRPALHLQIDALTRSGSNGNRHAPGVIDALPRRPAFPVRADADFAPPPRRQPEVFEASV